MTISVTQSGFTDMFGTIVPHVINGVDAATIAASWVFDFYSDNTGKTITFNMGGWFDASTLSRSHIHIASYYYLPAGSYAMQLSEDGTNWYNMPDATSSVILGSSPDQITDFTPWPDSTNFKYIRFIGIGGSYDMPGWFKEHGYLSYLAYYSTIAFLQGDGTPLVVDTVTVPNPHPPTGDPDTDDGASNPPTAPADSGVPVNVSGLSMAVARSDPGSVRVSGLSMAVARSDPGVVHVSGVSMLVMTKAPKTIKASMIGEGTLSAKMNVAAHLAVSISGEGQVAANIKLPGILKVAMQGEGTMSVDMEVKTPINLSVSMTDEARMTAFYGTPPTIQMISYVTGR